MTLHSRGLSDLTHRELTDLLRALEVGSLALPASDLALRQAGLDSTSVPHALAVLGPCDRAAARSVIQVALAERQHRPPPRLELVWTGPESSASLARDTGIVVRQLFERAQREVIIGGFRFDHGHDIFLPLYQRMQQGLRVRMFVDIKHKAKTHELGHAYAQRAIDDLLRNNWPFGPPYPDIYYDPRSAVEGPPWVSLHAKCIVVDDHWVFITSANFTERAQTRNLEVGVCIEDRAFAGDLAAQWRMLVNADLVTPYR